MKRRWTDRLRAAALSLLLAAGLVYGPAATPALAWPESDQQIGARAHPGIVEQNGGVLDDATRTDYVERIGRKLVAASARPDETWTFTVLDTPVVNAFAIPGGYIYVTRGLLALAGDEAQLAGVLGHEIGHLTAGHVQDRGERNLHAGIGLLAGAVIGGLLGGSDGIGEGLDWASKIGSGYVAHFSQKQEFEADEIGVRLLARAGYDPMAQADFLDRMAAKAGLDAELRGKSYNPNSVDFFSSHPATGDRVRKAVRAARPGASDGADRGAARYIDTMDGLIYGDAPEQGYVRGQRFSHPTMRFTFAVPDGFAILNSDRTVDADGPGMQRLTLSGDALRSEDMATYLGRHWLPAFQREVKSGAPGKISRGEVNGLPMARVTLPIERRGKPATALLVAIRHDGRIFRFVGIAPRDDAAVVRQLSDAVGSFRALSAEEAARLKPYRIRSYTVRRGDTVATLADKLPALPRKQAQFRTLNGLAEGEEPRRGDRVKLIVEAHE
ncbi:M48 family metalloprotease [Oceanomicrobium pacificus]|uniref:M48 family metalloprotease n=1 Tax=Oceanomicrobium pacificus TaxID=2692916 RepID=A0A6B0U167_9RHOB|nr:M48 family metalloprotease [Oceanomicrobium pacificus]MXU64851.1 M48 family metalloprotease [Oceanomicrobium pacificus]